MTPLLPAVEAARPRGADGACRPGVVRRLAGRPVVVDGQVLDPETQWMLRLQRLARDRRPPTVPIAEARRRRARQSRLAGGRQPVGEVRDLERARRRRPDPGPALRAALARPAAPTRRPLLVFIHGGGMVFGDLESHDATCRFLAERADVRVLAVDYRLAPEHPFPAAVEDCWAALPVGRSSTPTSSAPTRTGSRSAATPRAAPVRRRRGQGGRGAACRCAFQLLVYPVDRHGRRRARAGGCSARASSSTSEFIDLARRRPTSTGGDTSCATRWSRCCSPRSSPPASRPAHVVTAGFDPLRDEGEAYARSSPRPGCGWSCSRYPGLIHGFFNVVGVGRSSRAAVAEIAAKLKAALHAG